MSELEAENKKHTITLIGESLGSPAVSGVVSISVGTWLGFVTSQETEEEMVKGTRFLRLIDALADPEFYKAARIDFDEKDDLYYAYDNKRLRSLQMALSIAEKALGINDEDTE